MKTTATYTITEPDELLIVNAIVTDVTCFGDSDGAINIDVTGGTMVLMKYDWNNDGVGDFNDPQDLANLPGGDYTILVRDANGCENTATYTVDEPTELQLGGEPLILDVTCNGASDGSIDISVSGGTPGYTFDWSNDGTGDFNDPEDLTGVPGGTYYCCLSAMPMAVRRQPLSLSMSRMSC